MTSERVAELKNFIRHMATAISNASLYSPEHQQVTRLCSEAFSNVIEAIGTGSEISLLLIDDELVVDGRPLDSNMYINRFRQALKSRGIGHIKILRGITRQELNALVTGLSKLYDVRGEIRSTENLRLGKVEVRLSNSEESDVAEECNRKILLLAEIPDEEIAKFMEIYETVRKHQKLNVVGIQEIVSGFVEAFREVADPLMALAPLRAMDEYTFTHSTNVCILNLAQAMALGIDGPLLHDIGIAAILHDIGKLFVPEEILNKPGRLDETEWELIKQHPIKGTQCLLDTPGVPRLAVVTAFEHHMKYNFTGYPQVSAGWQQNLCSQMTTVSDFFDALRTKRVYRDSMEFERVSCIMTDLAGSDLHPTLTRNFLKILNRLTALQADSVSPQPEAAPITTNSQDSTLDNVRS